MTTHVKVARCIINPQTTKEIVLSLNDGGEAQLWERKTWEQYLQYVNENPSARGTQYYPWTYIEDMNPPHDDLRNYILLPEKTNGKEFQVIINQK